jgi:hypothetical protein
VKTYHMIARYSPKATKARNRRLPFGHRGVLEGQEYAIVISTPRLTREDAEPVSLIRAMLSKSRCCLARPKKLSEFSDPEDSSALRTSHYASGNRNANSCPRGKGICSHGPLKCPRFRHFRLAPGETKWRRKLAEVES